MHSQSYTTASGGVSDILEQLLTGRAGYGMEYQKTKEATPQKVSQDQLVMGGVDAVPQCKEFLGPKRPAMILRYDHLPSGQRVGHRTLHII